MKKTANQTLISNPLNNNLRIEFLKLSKVCKENNILSPYKRKALYEFGKFDQVYEKRIPIVNDIIDEIFDYLGFNDLEGEIKSIKGLENFLDISIKIAEVLSQKALDIKLKNGDPEAEYLCALAYMREKKNKNLNFGEISYDPRKGVSYFLKSASKSYPSSYFELGNIYYYGEGKVINKDHKKAIDYYKKAADLNHPDAQYWLGVFYEAGDIVSKNEKKAFEYFKKAADQNHYEAILSVGLYYYFGEVVEKNDILALEYINKSAEFDYEEALFYLGIIYDEGEIVSRDEKKSKEYFQRASELGHSEAKKALKEFQRENEVINFEKSKIDRTSNKDRKEPQINSINKKDGNVIYLNYKNSTSHLLTLDESEKLEFKETAFCDFKNNKHNQIVHSLMKTICAFLNSYEGGTIIIGIQDNKKIIGIDQELNSQFIKKKNKDGYQLRLRDNIKNWIDNLANQDVDVSFEEVENKVICKINVGQSRYGPVFLTSPNSTNLGYRGYYYIKNGNKVDQLFGKEMIEHIYVVHDYFEYEEY